MLGRFFFSNKVNNECCLTASQRGKKTIDLSDMQYAHYMVNRLDAISMNTNGRKINKQAQRWLDDIAGSSLWRRRL